MESIIGTATSTFETTTGLTFANVISFMSDQVMLVLGTGLGVLQAMIPWILALAVISAIVYFLFRAFRFFRH